MARCFVEALYNLTMSLDDACPFCFQTLEGTGNIDTYHYQLDAQ